MPPSPATAIRGRRLREVSAPAHVMSRGAVPWPSNLCTRVPGTPCLRRCRPPSFPDCNRGLGPSNGRHQIEQRLARWLMMAHDRANGDVFPMTHEFLSLMLGVRRAGVTVAAGALQRAGLIHYDRGSIEILDRPGLEAGACECHDAV